MDELVRAMALMRVLVMANKLVVGLEWWVGERVGEKAAKVLALVPLKAL